MITALVVATVLSQTHYTPEEARAIFAQANDAYYRENYDQAEANYRKLLDHGFGGPDVMFNLGTSYLAAGRLGEAVLYLERARRAGGQVDDIEAQLAVAHSRQLDQVVGEKVQVPFLQRLAGALNESLVSWLFLVSWGLAFLLWVLFRFLPPGRRTAVAVVASLSLMLALPAGLLVGIHAYVRHTVTEAVVVAGSLQARQLPKESAPVSFEVHSGLKVNLVERNGQFVKIRLPNGLEGWTQKEGVAEI